MSIQLTPTICNSHSLTFPRHFSSCSETLHSEVLFSYAASLLLDCAQVHTPVIQTQDLTLDMASAFPHSSEGAPLDPGMAPGWKDQTYSLLASCHEGEHRKGHGAAWFPS